MFSLKTSNRTFIESVLLLLLLLILLLAVYEVLQPFFGILTFALIFAVSFSTPYRHLVKMLKGKRKLAAVIYVVLLLLIFTIPFIYIVSAISDHFREAVDFVGSVKENGLPPLPSWIQNLPIVGDSINSFWLELKDPQQTIGHYEAQIKKGVQLLLASGSGILGATVQFVFGIIISAFFLVSDHQILLPIKAGMKHLLGAKEGIELVHASGEAIKGVMISVMGTALITAFISWIGFSIAGIPFALGLSALVFFFVAIQVGPLLVWIPLIIWQASIGETGWTIFLIIYAIALIAVENLIRSILIAKSGGKLPFLVLFIGVTGGVIVWGFTGMFKGAIIMSIFYTIFSQWLHKKKLEHDLLVHHHEHPEST